MMMVAKVAHEYAGKQHQEGEEYECEDKDVPVVIAVGWATPREHYSSMPRRRVSLKRMVAS